MERAERPALSGCFVFSLSTLTSARGASCQSSDPWLHNSRVPLPGAPYAHFLRCVPAVIGRNHKMLSSRAIRLTVVHTG